MIQPPSVLERAIVRGDLPMTVDTKLFNDAVGGLLYWRIIITREPADRIYIDGLVRFILAGLLPSAGAGPAARSGQ